jgi:hypothetical protein
VRGRWTASISTLRVPCICRGRRSYPGRRGEIAAKGRAAAEIAHGCARRLTFHWWSLPCLFCVCAACGRFRCRTVAETWISPPIVRASLASRSSGRRSCRVLSSRRPGVQQQRSLNSARVVHALWTVSVPTTRCRTESSLSVQTPEYRLLGPFARRLAESASRPGSRVRAHRMAPPGIASEGQLLLWDAAAVLRQ